MTEELFEVEMEVLELEMEDGTIAECGVRDEFEIDDRKYLVLSPVDEENRLDDETLLFYICTEEGEDLILDPIEDPEELKLVIAAYEDLLEDEVEEELELETIQVPLSDGTTVLCAIVDEFEIDDEPYMVVCKIEEGNILGEDELYFKVSGEGDDLTLSTIEDEMELAFAVAAHEDLFEDEEADEE